MTTSIGWSDPRTIDGQLLWSARFGDAEVADLETRLGSHATAGQLQQRPAPRAGGLFKKYWWKPYKDLPTITKAEVMVDSAFKDGVGNDYSVFALWATNGLGDAYLVDIIREKVQFPDLIMLGHRAIEAAHVRFPRLKIPLVVEDKASGQSAIQTWNRPHRTEDRTYPALSVVPFPIPAGVSKLVRAEGVTPIVEGGRAFIPTDAPWLKEWLDEHSKFPAVVHDDQVDTTSMGLARMTAKRGGAFGFS